jgi:ATPase family associated with various cellular activities (AAA)
LARTQAHRRSAVASSAQPDLTLFATVPEPDVLFKSPDVHSRDPDTPKMLLNDGVVLYRVLMPANAIVKSIVRIALANDSPQLRHQVERLIASLVQDGEAREAAALSKMLSQPNRSTDLAPSRVTRSFVERGAPGQNHHLETLGRAVPVPVDKETSAPLATVIFPDDIDVDLPRFPEWVQVNIDGMLEEWSNAGVIEAAGMSASLSCLIYGAPGTGKTTLALWLAQRLRVPAVVARLDGLISSYLGTTARNLGNLFSFANRYECVLILDEFDAIAKVRDDPNEVGEIKRVVNALLQNMDSRSERGVMIGVTNHDALLDSAIWRRFEVQLAIPLPDFADRVRIAQEDLGNDVVAIAASKLLAWVCEGLSGAELRTMTAKFRKRRLFDPSLRSTPLRIIAQLSQSTSVRILRERAEQLSSDETSLTSILWDANTGLTQSEMALLMGRDPKTIGRRLSRIPAEVSTNGE